MNWFFFRTVGFGRRTIHSFLILLFPALGCKRDGASGTQECNGRIVIHIMSSITLSSPHDRTHASIDCFGSTQRVDEDETHTSISRETLYLTSATMVE